MTSVGAALGAIILAAVLAAPGAAGERWPSHEVPGDHLVPDPFFHRLDRAAGVVVALGRICSGGSTSRFAVSGISGQPAQHALTAAWSAPAQ